MKYTDSKGNIIIYLFVGFFLFGLLSLFLLNLHRFTKTPEVQQVSTMNQQGILTSSPTSIPSPNKQRYTSSNLKISFEKPTNSTIKEIFNAIEISTPQGRILIDRTSTIFKNLEDHIKDLAKKNHLKYVIKDTVNDGAVTFLKVNLISNANTEGTITYFVLNNGFVYVIYSPDEAMETTLPILIETINFN